MAANRYARRKHPKFADHIVGKEHISVDEVRAALATVRIENDRKESSGHSDALGIIIEEDLELYEAIVEKDWKNAENELIQSIQVRFELYKIFIERRRNRRAKRISAVKVMAG